MAAIGIDIGTTFSCVGFCVNGKVEIIPNENDKRLTPAYVAFTEDERLYGDSAKHQAPLNLKNTLYNIKRIIGRPYNDSSVQKDVKYLGYDVQQDGHGKCQIPLICYGNSQNLYPEQITAMTIGKMKKIAEDHIGQTVSKAVLSVPACFNEDQRQATINAGRMAGLEVLGLINEPTAAALAYAYDKKVVNPKDILIFDFGGGKIDVSLAKVNENKIHILGTYGESNFGGDDFDITLVQHYFNEFQTKGLDLYQDQKAIIRLKAACEKAKRSLSAALRTRISVDSLHNNEPFEAIITREEFENINAGSIDRVSRILNNILKQSKKVDEIVLVGGSSRIPKVRQMLQETFNQQHLSRTMNPDEAVAHGAAIQAAILNKDAKVPQFIISDPMEQSINLSKLKRNLKGAGNIPELDNAKVRKMAQEVESFDHHDEQLRADSSARNGLENYAYRAMKRLRKTQHAEKLKEEEKQEIREACDNAIQWLEINPRAGKKDCEEKLAELTKTCEDIFEGRHEDQPDNIKKRESPYKNQISSNQQDIGERRNVEQFQNQIQTEEQLQHKLAAIRHLEQYVRAIQQYTIFENYMSVLTEDDKMEIDVKCREINHILSGTTEAMTLNDIKAATLGLENFVESKLDILAKRVWEEKEKRVSNRPEQPTKQLAKNQATPSTDQYEKETAQNASHRIKAQQVDLLKELKLFKIYIESIKSLTTFNLKDFVSMDLQREIEMRCRSEENYLEDNLDNMDLRKLHARRMGLEDFVSSVESRLQLIKKKLANDQIKAQKDNLEKEIRAFEKYIASVTSLSIFEDLVEFLSPEIEQEIQTRCRIEKHSLNENLDNMDLRKLHARRMGLEDFVSSVESRLQLIKKKLADDQIKIHQDNLRKEIKEYKTYISCIKSHAIFDDLKEFLSTGTKQKIKKKCHVEEQYLDENLNVMDLKKLRNRKSGLEEYVKSVQSKLQIELEVARKQEKERKMKEWDEAYNKLHDYITSTLQYIEAERQYMSRNHVHDIEMTCDDCQRWLRANYSQISTAALQSKLKELRYNIENIRRKAEEEKEASRKKENERKQKEWDESYRRLHEYISSTLHYFEKEQQYISTQNRKENERIFNDCQRWLEDEHKQINSTDLHTKLLELQDKVEYIKCNVEEEKKRNRAYQELCNYVSDVINDMNQRIGKNKFVGEHVYRVINKCNNVKNSTGTNLKRLNVDAITKTHKELQQYVEDIKNQISEKERAADEEEQLRHEAYMKLQIYIETLRVFLTSHKGKSHLADSYVTKIEKYCRIIHERIRNNYHQMTAEKIVRKTKQLESNVGMLWKEYQDKNAETVQWHDSYTKFCDYIGFVRQFVISELQKEDGMGKYLNELTVKSNEMEKWITQNKDHLTYNEIDSSLTTFQNSVSKSIERLDTARKVKSAEVAREQAEENKRKKDALQKLANYISQVKSLAVFEPYLYRLNRQDEEKIEKLCNEEIDRTRSENLSSVQIEERISYLKDTFGLICRRFEQEHMIQKEAEQRMEKQKWSEAYNNLEKYIKSVEKFLRKKSVEDAITKYYIKLIDERLKDTVSWLNDKLNQISTTQLGEEYEDLKESVESNIKQLKQKQDERKEKAILQFQEIIKDVRTLDYFKPFRNMLTQSKRLEIEKTCNDWQQWLHNFSHEFTPQEILQQQERFKNLPERILSRLQLDSQRREERNPRRFKAAEDLRLYIDDVQDFLTKHGERISFKNKKVVDDLCQEGHQYIDSYWEFPSGEIIGVRNNLAEVVTEIRRKLYYEDRKKQESVRRQRNEACTKLQDYIERVKSALEPLKPYWKEAPHTFTLCKEAEEMLHRYRVTLSKQQIDNQYEAIRTQFEHDHYKLMAEYQRQQLTLGRNKKSGRANIGKYVTRVMKTIEKIESQSKSYRSKMIESERHKLSKMFRTTREWCEEHPNARRKESEIKIQHLKTMWDAILNKIRARSKGEDNREALHNFAILAKRKIHDNIYKDKVTPRYRNKLEGKYKLVLSQLWSDEEAGKQLKQYKNLCREAFEKIDKHADPYRRDEGRRWYY